MSLVKDFQLTSPSVSHSNPPTMTFSPFSNVHEIDLTRAGIMPIPFDMPALRNMPDGAMPDGAIVGSQNAYMATSADVVPLTTTRAEACSSRVSHRARTSMSSLTACRKECLQRTPTAVWVSFSTPWLLRVLSPLMASAKRVASAPAAPSKCELLHRPHRDWPWRLTRLAPMGPRTFTAMGTRHQANTTINIAVNGFILFTVPSDANGSFTFSAAPAASPDGPVLFTASTATVGSLAGTSLENRADAGDGDLNVTRGFVDRPYVPSSTGGFMALSAEGFLPGETLVLSVCGSGSAPADANGALAPSW